MTEHDDHTDAAADIADMVARAARAHALRTVTAAARRRARAQHDWEAAIVEARQLGIPVRTIGHAAGITHRAVQLVINRQPVTIVAAPAEDPALEW
jgi:hypothetical protein